MNNSDILRILSPLVFFVVHVMYLVVWSPGPFPEEWIDGSFTFFLALVLCNIIRAHVVAKAGRQKRREPTPRGDRRDDRNEPAAATAPPAAKLPP